MLMHKSKCNQCQKWNKYTIPAMHKSQALSYLSFGCVAIWLSVNELFGLSELRPVQFYQIVCVCVCYILGLCLSPPFSCTHFGWLLFWFEFPKQLFIIKTLGGSMDTHYQTTFQPLLHQNHPSINSCETVRNRIFSTRSMYLQGNRINMLSRLLVYQPKQITSLICDKFSASFANFHLTFFHAWNFICFAISQWEGKRIRFVTLCSEHKMFTVKCWSIILEIFLENCANCVLAHLITMISLLYVSVKLRQM